MNRFRFVVFSALLLLAIDSFAASTGVANATQAVTAALGDVMPDLMTFVGSVLALLLVPKILIRIYHSVF